MLETLLTVRIVFELILKYQNFENKLISGSIHKNLEICVLDVFFDCGTRFA